MLFKRGVPLSIIRETTNPIKGHLPVEATLVCLPNILIRKIIRTSLVAQWIRIHLPTQGTWVPSLIREDSTSLGATTEACSPTAWAPVLHKRSHWNEKPLHRN